MHFRLSREETSLSASDLSTHNSTEHLKLTTTTVMFLENPHPAEMTDEKSVVSTVRGGGGTRSLGFPWRRRAVRLLSRYCARYLCSRSERLQGQPLQAQAFIAGLLTLLRCLVKIAVRFLSRLGFLSEPRLNANDNLQQEGCWKFKSSKQESLKKNKCGKCCEINRNNIFRHHGFILALKNAHVVKL